MPGEDTKKALKKPSGSQDKTSAEDNCKYKLGRSISLSKLNQESPKVDEKPIPTNSKRKAPDHPSPTHKTSPKSKVSVKDRKSQITLAEKYGTQRNLKDMNKEKAKFKRERTCKKSIP